MGKGIIETREVTAAELGELLLTVTGSTKVSIVYETAHRFSRTVKGIKPLTQVTSVAPAYLCHDYGNKVRNLTGDTTFQAEEMKGKTRLSPCIVRSDKSGELLLDYKVLKISENEERTMIKRLGIFHNGEEISVEEAEKRELFTPAYYAEEKEAKTAGRGLVETEDNFAMFTLGMKNIKRLVMRHVEYIVIPEQPTTEQ